MSAVLQGLLGMAAVMFATCAGIALMIRTAASVNKSVSSEKDKE